MKLFTNLNDYVLKDKTFVTIGTFDGVHIGHKKVIKNLINNSGKKKATSLVFTFFPHPKMVLQKNSNIKLINTIDERIELLKKTGLENLVVYNFTTEFATLSALEFVKNILVTKLNVACLVVGYDHHFGKNREGNFGQLEVYGATYGFNVQEILQKDIDSITVSSTKIRTAIENGEIEKATSYLGYYFMLSGEVVRGKSLGEKIGFPTANLFIKETYKLLPKTGAYVVKATIDHKTVYGMMNIGYRPTVSGKNQTIEIHFFELNKNLYHKKLRVEVLHFLRNEQKFDSIEALKAQLMVDKENAINYLGLLN